MKKIKVAIFHCGFIYSGGGERIVLEEAKGLIKKGYDVEVYAPTVDKKRCYPEALKELKVKTFLPSFWDSLPLRNAVRMVVTSLIAPFLSLKFNNVDIFIGANQPGAWIAFCMAKVLGKPYLVYLNQPNRVIYPRPVDVEYGWYTTVKDYHFLYNILRFFKEPLRFLDNLSIKRANKVLTNGGYIGDIIENIYAIKTNNLPAGAKNHSVSKLLRGKNMLVRGQIKIGKKVIRKPYLLITNRHDPQKRFDYVIKVLKILQTQYPEVNLIIPGPFTNHTNSLIKLVKKLGIEQKVYFVGEVSQKDLERLYQHCFVYCYPSPQEDFGLGPLEAGGWGVPTVAWKHGGPTITVEDKITGFLVKPYNVKEYANALGELFSKPNVRDRMGRAAWNRTTKIFSWDNHVDKLDMLIEETLG